MCNAFNHPSYCECGFGKDGLMRYSSFYNDTLTSELSAIASAFLLRSKDTRTLPNYRCNYCGSDVFFFQSHNGGKVLFDALGKPWPKHNCMGIEYLRKKSALQISCSQWMTIGGLTATPSHINGASIFSGVIALSGGDQSLIDLRFLMSDPILVKELYIDANAPKNITDPIEILVLLDDGRHEFHDAIISYISPYEMQDFSRKAPYKNQPKLI